MNKKINTCDELLARLESLNGETKQVKTGMRSIPTYNHTFWAFMRDGMPRNALKENSDGAGGYLVPDEYESKLVSALEIENHLRRISNVIQTRHRLIIPTVIGHSAAAWIEEGEQITETEPSFGQIVLDAYKMGTLILASDELLEDSGADIEKLILEQFSRRIGKCEEEAFLTGDGNHKPMGLLTQAPVGSVSAEAGVLSVDDALDLYFSVGQEYRANAVWFMSEDAHRTLRKVKSAMGRNIWEPSLIEGEPEKLLGRPVYVSEFMPEVASDSKPILFGDFNYFWIGDRGKRSVKRLNERYADHGQVGFIATQRVDAKLVLPEAIKSLKIKTA